MNKRKPANEILVVGSIRMTLRQWEKLRKLGGGKWVREKVDLQREIGDPPRQEVKLSLSPEDLEHLLNTGSIPAIEIPSGGDNNDRQPGATHACELNRAYDGSCLICMRATNEKR